MDLVTLTDYQVLEELHCSANSRVQRARSRQDGRSVILKSLQSELPSAQELARLQHEYKLLHRLQLPCVVRALALEPIGQRLTMVLEDLPGCDLAQLLRNHGRLEIAAWLDLCCRLVEALTELHRAGILHKQICPANLLYDADSGRVSFIDFGFATALTSESLDLLALGLPAGTLPYMAPEQSGRMNREVDYRADYYALGITFYELLIGSLPFHAEDALGWVYCHIARNPPDPCRLRSEVPEAIGQIIRKLIAKDPEQRYQSTRGLLADLDHCRQQWRRGGQISLFALGRQDVPETFRIPQRLYGRDAECTALLRCFKEVARGHSDCLLVAGYAGVGKSALVHEVRRPIVERRGFFLQGKFEQFQRDVPYFALTQALRAWARELLAESSERLAQWRQRLGTAVGQNAQLLIDLIPELAQVLGPAPALVEADPREARHRFLITFRSFIKTLARPEHPLVLFLDDLQWSDSSTLDLLSSLLSWEDLPHFLLLGAYRSNEVDAGHPLMLMLDGVRRERRITTLNLKPLDQGTVNRIIAETLHQPPQQTQQLTELIWQKTEGNPFFVNEVLKKLHADGSLRFDHGDGVWRWDWAGVRATTVSENVIAFMVERLRRLAPETRETLLLASCLGNEFELETLATVAGRSPAESAHRLWSAVQEGVLVPLSHDYMWAHAQDATAAACNASYRFQHDRVQQAAYSLLADDRRRATHLQIARMLWQHALGQPSDERVLEIARHYNESRELIDDDGERLRLVALNLASGRKAKAASAYEPALRYLRTGIELLPADAWQQQYELAFPLHREAAECAYLCGDYSLAERHAGSLLEHARSALEKAEVHHMQVRQYVVQGQMHRSLEAGRAGLALLGLKLPAHPGRAAALVEELRVRWRMRGRRVADLLDLPPLPSGEVRLAIQLLMELGPPAYLLGHGNLLALAAIKQVNLSLRHGHCPASAYAYTFYAMIRGAVFGEPKTAAEFARLGIDLNERQGDFGLRCRIHFMYAFFNQHWNEPWSQLEAHYRRSIDAGYQSGDLFYLAYSAVWLPQHDTQIDLVRATERGRQSLKIIEATRFEDARDIAVLCQQQRLNLLGLTRSPLSFDDASYDEAAVLDRMRGRSFQSGLAVHHILKLEIAVHHGDAAAAVSQITTIENEHLLDSMVGCHLSYEYHLHVFLAGALAWPDAAAGERLQWWRRMRRAWRAIRRWARHCPANFGHAERLLRAEWLALRGRIDAALRHFDQAAQAARSHGWVRYQGLAHERAAAIALRHGRSRLVQPYVADALLAYNRWGAAALVRRLETLFGLRSAPAGSHLPSAGGGPHPALLASSQELDIASIFKAARSISGELELDRLLASLLRIVQENAAAQRVLLLLGDEHADWRVQAEIIGDADPVVLQATPLAAAALPASVIHYVIRSLTPLAIGDASNTESFARDPYIRQHRCKSVLCLPVLNQGQLVAVLYLENNGLTDAFTPERISVLNLLASQASISIAHARLYSHITELNRAYQRFVPKQFLSLLDKRSILDVRLGDQQQGSMSILFSDIRLFTSLSERMSAQETFNFLNSYLSHMEPLIGEHAGFIDKYIGDAIMALFPRCADDAVQAALAMLQQLSLYNQGRLRAGYPAVSIGIGINSGALIFGTIGGPERLEGTVIGDTVNLASRIEGMTKFYGAALLVSEHTLRQLRDPERYQTRYVDRVRVKGKALPVSLFELLDAEPAALRERKQDAQRWLKPALEHYQHGQFDAAIELLRACQQSHPDEALARIYLERCQRYRNAPVSGPWEGVSEFEHK